jgi:hypothetical protein
MTGASVPWTPIDLVVNGVVVSRGTAIREDLQWHRSGVETGLDAGFDDPS